MQNEVKSITVYLPPFLKSGEVRFTLCSPECKKQRSTKILFGVRKASPFSL